MSEPISQIPSTNDPTDKFIACPKWQYPINRVKLLEAIQAARHNIAQNNRNNSWVSSRELRQRMQEKGVDVKTRTVLRLLDE